MINDAYLNKSIVEKSKRIQDIIKNTILSIKSNKNKDIFSNNDAILSINILTELYEKTCLIQNESCSNKNEQVKMIENLQKISDKLFMIICGFGTKNMGDLLYIGFGSELIEFKNDNPIIKDKYELIVKHIQPIGCKIIQWKSNKSYNNSSTSFCVKKIKDKTLIKEDSNLQECFEMDKSSNSFYQKILGICVVIHNDSAKKTIIISGIVDDLQLELFTNEYIKHRKNEITIDANNYDKTEKDNILRLSE